MPPVELTSPVAGLRVGDPYSGPMENWLLAYGYAKDGAKTDKVDVTAPLPQHDPTLAENREAPGADLSIKGESVEGGENASEVLGEANVVPLQPTRIVGAGPTPEADAQREELDGRVDSDEVTEKAPQTIVAGDEPGAPAEPDADPLPGADEPTAEPKTEDGSEDKGAAVEAASDLPAAGQSTSGTVESTS